MKTLLAAWAIVGFAIAGCWALYALANAPATMMSRDPILALIEFTCPVVFVGFYFHFGVSLYATVVANGAIYALLGLIVETLRRRMKHAQ
jgi:hypothetical protein